VILSINAAPLRDAAGNVVSVIASLTDISRRKQAEAERERLMDRLRETNERLVLSNVEAQRRAVELDTTIKSIADGLLIYDAEGKIVLMNPAADRITGYSPAERALPLTERLALLGMTVAEYVGGVNYFYSDDQCTGCGVCAKVCLSGKIRMVDEKPLWQKSILCYMCYACVNFCPREAVQIKSIPGVRSHTTENCRYSHPFATAQEIACQKAGGQPPHGRSSHLQQGAHPGASNC
jgi:ferredoxin